MSDDVLGGLATDLEDYEARVRALLDRLGATPAQVAALGFDVVPDLRGLARRADPTPPAAPLAPDPHPRAAPAPAPGVPAVSHPDHYEIPRDRDDGADPEPGPASYELGEPIRGAQGDARRVADSPPRPR
jgi:hypothetical protein